MGDLLFYLHLKVCHHIISRVIISWYVLLLLLLKN